VSVRDQIVVRGARQHNLKNIDVAFPRGRLVVITGPSGSGKSSLAFDTIYAEGQRRYIESLGAQARQHLPRLPKPDVDLIEGLSPTIGVQSGELSRSPRSTVGTVTEIDHLLRLLLARLGQPHCPRCGQAIVVLGPAQMVDRVLARAPGARFSVRAPIARVADGDVALGSELARLRREGFMRAVVDGKPVDLHDLERAPRRLRHALEVDVDRLSVKQEARSRLSDSIELALRAGQGVVRVVFEDASELVMSERWRCTQCGFELGEITPASLSWNSPRGECERCHGLGEQLRLDPERVVPDPESSLRGGAIAAWGIAEGRYYARMLEQLQSALAVDLDQPFRALPARTRERILHGAPGTSRSKPYEGVLPGLERRLREWSRRIEGEESLEWLEEELAPFMQRERCSACAGARLNPGALALRLFDRNIAELDALALEQLVPWLQQCAWSPTQQRIAEPIVRELLARVAVLVDLGLGYLSAGRTSRSLSRGEAERIRLAAQLGAGLSGVLYVLDEPTAGLHPRDTERLLGTLLALRDRGNTLLVVEHDLDVIERADFVLDLGPGAGERGGRVMASGSPAEIAASDGPTARYLAGRGSQQAAKPSRGPSSGAVRIRDARIHNLQGVDAELPLARLTCVTGVSGSGKSSLVMHTLLPAARALLRGERADVAAGIEGLDVFARVVHVDQAPIGRTPRSTPATYAGLFGGVRELFASLPEARARGFGPERFSFNVKGGRCETCQGAGVARVPMQFLPDVYVACEDCGGARYERETLQVRYRGSTIADVLGASVDSASELFAQLPRVSEVLASLRAVGLGYLRLGQSATTLSAGEAQRLRLARELARRDHGRTLYVLDEPTAGLHASEVELLAQVLESLLAAGHTLVLVEHNLQLIRRADHVIDLGPEAGAAGGRVIASGTPEQVAQCAQSHTGRWLAHAR